MRSFVALAVVLAIPTALLAHETWLLPRGFTIATGKAVALDLTSGMTFPDLDHPIKADRVAVAKYRLAGQTHDIKTIAAGEKSLAFEFTSADAGIAAAWVSLKPKRIELAEEQVAEYFAEINAPESLRKVWDAKPKPRQWREVYAKHAKSFVRVGDPAADDSGKEPVGLGVEIVPEFDPTRLRVGKNYAFRAVKGGKPFAGFAIGLATEGSEKPVWHNTDKDGRFQVRFEKAGRAMLHGTDLRPSAMPDTDYESDFTTLTLDIGK